MECARPVGDTVGEVGGNAANACFTSRKRSELEAVRPVESAKIRGPSGSWPVTPRPWRAGEKRRSANVYARTCDAAARARRPAIGNHRPPRRLPEHAEEGTAEHLQHRTAGSFRVLAAWPAPSGCRCVKIQRSVARCRFEARRLSPDCAAPESAEGVRCALTARPSAADSGSRLEDGKDERCAPACIQMHTSIE